MNQKEEMFRRFNEEVQREQQAVPTPLEQLFGVGGVGSQAAQAAQQQMPPHNYNAQPRKRKYVESRVIETKEIKQIEGIK